MNLLPRHLLRLGCMARRIAPVPPAIGLRQDQEEIAVRPLRAALVRQEVHPPRQTGTKFA